MTIIQAQPLKQFGISGPASALDNEIAVFDGVTGKKIKAATGIICPSSGRLDLAEIRAKDGNGLKLYEDGGNGIFVEDGGDIGIGTVTPGNILHIEANFVPTASASVNSPGIVFTDSVTGSNKCGIIPTQDARDIDFFAHTGGVLRLRSVTTVSDEFRMSCGTTGDDSYHLLVFDGSASMNQLHMITRAHSSATTAPYPICWRYEDCRGGGIGSAEIMRLTTDGYLGIGAQIPTAFLDIDSDILRLRTAKTPASAGAAGNQGDMCWDADFHYRCVATNTWKRTAITTW